MIDQTNSRGANDTAPPASSRQRAIEAYETAKDRAGEQRHYRAAVRAWRASRTSPPAAR